MLPLFFFLGFGLFATSRISAVTVKMSDFSLSLEDIDLLINGKIPLIISKPGRLMQPTKFCTILFWRSTEAIRNRLLFSLVTFSRRFTVFPFQKIKKPCFFRGANTYPPRKNACRLDQWQAARLTSPFDFNFFRQWAFPPQNIYWRKDIFLRFNLFIKAV